MSDRGGSPPLESTEQTEHPDSDDVEVVALSPEQLLSDNLHSCEVSIGGTLITGT